MCLYMQIMAFKSLSHEYLGIQISMLTLGFIGRDFFQLFRRRTLIY